MKKRALITGVSGQDGSYLAEFLLEKGYEVYGLIRMSSVNNKARLKNIVENENFHIVYGDMTDESSLFKAVMQSLPDEIYNLAAQSSVGLSGDFSEYTTNVNALGILKLINIVYELDLQDKIKIYQPISSEIFDSDCSEVLSEKSEVNPCNIYSCSKAYARIITNSFKKKGLFIVNGIPFIHESPRRPEIFVSRKITKSAVKIKLGKMEKFHLGNLSVERDWGHAKDFVRGMWLSLQQNEPDEYVFATGIPTSLRDFCMKVFACLGLEIVFKGIGLEEKAYDAKTGKVLIEVNPNFVRPNEKMTQIGDYSKAKEKLGWTPEYTIDDIIKEMVEEDLKEESGN